MSVVPANEELFQSKEKEIVIPDYLIYEVVKGRPIYRKGYKDVLNNLKTLEEIKMESKLQSWLKAQITGILIYLLNTHSLSYEVFTGELGLNLPEKTKRGADIAIFKSESIELDATFSDLPPEIIIEIDVAIDTEKQTEMDYVHEKIDDYLKFGVKKVIWIFTKTKKVITAETTEQWLTYNWDKDIELLNEVIINLNELIKNRKLKK